MQAGQQEAAEEEHEYHGTRVCEEKDRKEASVPELQAEVVKKYDDIRALSAAIANKERDIKDLNARMTHGRRVGAESSLCVTRATWATMAYQRGGSVQSNIKAADVSGNGGRDDMCYGQQGPVTFCPRGRVGTGGYEEPQGQEGISD